MSDQQPSQESEIKMNMENIITPTPIVQTVHAEEAREALKVIKKSCELMNFHDMKAASALISLAESLAKVDSAGWHDVTGMSRDAWVKANLSVDGKPVDPHVVGRWIADWKATEGFPEIQALMKGTPPMRLTIAAMACKIGKSAKLGETDVVKMAKEKKTTELRTIYTKLLKEEGIEHPHDQGEQSWPVIAGKVEPNVNELLNEVVQRLFRMEGIDYDPKKTTMTKTMEVLVGFVSDTLEALGDVAEKGDSNRLAAIIAKLK